MLIQYFLGGAGLKHFFHVSIFIIIVIIIIIIIIIINNIIIISHVISFSSLCCQLLSQA